MKYITKVQTFDGITHDNAEKAKHYLDRMHSDLLSRITNKVLSEGNGKHIQTGDWISNNLDMFLKLHVIKINMTLEMEIEDEQD